MCDAVSALLKLIEVYDDREFSIFTTSNFKDETTHIIFEHKNNDIVHVPDSLIYRAYRKIREVPNE